MKFEDFYKRLYLARQEAKFSSEELGKKIGKNNSSVIRYESGQVQIPILTFFDFADATGKHPSWFFMEEIPPPSVESAIESAPDLDAGAKRLLLELYLRFRT